MASYHHTTYQETQTEGALLLMRFVCDRETNINECKKALIRSKSIIENYRGKVIGVAADVYAKEVNAWPLHPKMSICVIWFPSVTNAVQWMECDTWFKQHDFLGGIKSIAVPLKDAPRFGYNTFLVTEYDIKYPDEFRRDFSDHVPGVIGPYNCQPFCAVTTHPTHVNGGWFHDRQNRHPVITISCFRSADDVLQVHRDYQYKDLLNRLSGIAGTKTIVFSLDPNLKREPQQAEHLKGRFSSQKM